MYNLLLTDDEQIVTDSLAFILEKNFPSQFEIFKASSGSEAINICRSNKIDIIFMDINMPGLNGLEAISEIKQFNPSAVIIILSAFDKFQYAQEAMALGAYRYLTKPVNRNLVTQTVRNALGIIDSLQGKITNDIEMKEKLSFVSSIVESDFIYSSIYPGSADVKDLHRYLEYFKISEGQYFYLCIELHGIGQGKNYETYLAVRDILLKSSACIVGPFMSSRIVTFFPFENSMDLDAAFIWQQELVREIFSAIAMKVGTKTKIGAGIISSDLNDTVRSYNSALKALNSISESGGTNFAMQTEGSGKKLVVDSAQSEIHLLNRLNSGDVDGTKSLTLMWVESLFDSGLSLDLVRNSVFRVLVTARSSVNEVQKGYSSEPAFNNTFSILNSCEDKSSILEYVLPQFVECAGIILRSHSQKENPVVSKAKAYIEAHLSGEISLEQTADEVGVNPFYLSKIFKEETGGNFIDYVNFNRLDKACKLLKEGDLSIKEVSWECGYSDQNYFSKIFRRKFGVTPTEYKNSIQAGSSI
ncbi:MAG: response regulator [Treponema sp.]|nr:response regulator [Treponema sp.]